MKKRISSLERQEQIIQGAMRIFADKGFRGTTTREIAQRLGISEALMFKYFPSKEALYRAIIKKRTDRAEEMLFPQEIIQAKDDRQVFQAIATNLIERNVQDPNFMRLLHFSALEGHELARLFFTNHAQKKIKLLARYIEQRIKEGVFRHVSPELAAQAFLGMIIHYVQARELFGLKRWRRFSPAEVIETFVQIFLKGLEVDKE
ncbi:MAG: TetR family transcriptional regulator [Thermodesulfobacteriota bacterium]